MPPFSTAALATVTVVHFKMAALKDAWLIISQSDWHEGVLQLWYWPFCVGLLCAALLGLLLLLHLCKDKSKLFKQHALGTFLYGWERVVPTKTPRTEDWGLSSGQWCEWVCTGVSVLTDFLLLSLLLVLLHTGSLGSLLVIGHVPPTALAFILRVWELFIARYPLIGGTDCKQRRNISQS